MTSYIYFIQAQGAGPIKIGVTQFNPLRRMVKIQSDCPWPVKLIGTIIGSVAQEKRIHMLLACYRTQGEWFSPHPIVLAAINEALSACSISRFETGRNRPNGESLKVLIRATGLSVMELRPDLVELMAELAA